MGMDILVIALFRRMAFLAIRLEIVHVKIV